MEWLGDLERALATNLYPLRVPIAVGVVIALVVGWRIASRRGWLAAARRHPARSWLVALLVLAVALPAGWYLGSPLFIRTSLVEPAPPNLRTQAPMTPPPSIPAAAPATAQPLPSANPPTLHPSRSGAFTGADDFHFGRGTARLIETEPGRWIVRFEDFSVRNGPDLYVYLSPERDGYAKQAVELGTLKATDGSFNYEVPAAADVGSANSVVIWCKQFAVQFAVAPLR